jgi:hypothetical protein
VRRFNQSDKIRGIGARAQYGTSRIKAHFGRYSWTTGEGEMFTIEDIDLETIGGIEQRPNNTSFGSGLWSDSFVCEVLQRIVCLNQ